MAGWNQVLEFLHQQHIASQQRELEWQLERQLQHQHCARLQKDLEAQEAANLALKRRVLMLETALREQRPKSLHAMPQFKEAGESQPNPDIEFIDSVVKQVAALQKQLVESTPKRASESVAPPRLDQAVLLKGHLDSIRTVAPLSSKLLCTAGDDCLVMVWDLERDVSLSCQREHSGPVLSSALGEDVLFSAGTEGLIRWHAFNSSGECTLAGKHEFQCERAEPVWDLSFCGRGRLLLATCGDKKLRLFQAHGQGSKMGLRLKNTFASKGEGKARSSAFTAGLILRGGSRLVSAAEHQKQLAVMGLEGKACEYMRFQTDQLSFSASQIIELDNGLVASAHEDKVVRLFDPLSTRPVQELRGHQDSVSCLAQSGQQLAFGTTGGVVGLWDLRRTVKLVEQTAHARKYEEGVGGVAWSGGRLVSGGADGSVRVWQVGSGQK